MSYKAGELYLIGEVDLRTSKDLPFYKIGIVRDKDNRSTEDRLREHQTGNPRLLRAHWVVRTPAVEQIETTLHGCFAPWRISGEWFHFDESQFPAVHKTTKDLAAQAKKKEDFLNTAEQLKSVESSDLVIKPSKDAIALYRRLGAIKANLSFAENGVKSLKAFFDSLYKKGDDVSDYYSLTSRIGTLEFDEEAFKEKHPKIWSKYLVSKSRPEQRFILSELSVFKKNQSLLNTDLNSLNTEIGRLVSGSKFSKNSLNQIHSHFLKMLTFQSPLEWEDTLIEAELKSLCGEASGIEGLCSWNRKFKESTSFDKTAFKNDHPEKWDLFTTRKPDTVSTALRRDRNYRA